MKLSCIRKKKRKNTIFQVKTISKDARKSSIIHVSFLILLKSAVLYVKKIRTYNFHHWTNEIKNKSTWFSCMIFVFYRKWKIKNTHFRCEICCKPWSSLNQTRCVFLLHDCFRRVQWHAHSIARLICQSLWTL